MSVWKSPLFLFGFLIILTMFFGSIIYSHYVPDSKKPTMIIRYDENKIPIDSPPIEPFKEMPFGTDRFGVSMLHKVIDGAKYTLGFAFLIAFARLLAGTILGLIFSQFPKSVLRMLNKLFDSFYYAPATIVAYLILYPVLQIFTWSIPKNEQTIFSFLVLVLIAVPPVMITVASETSKYLENEFISSVKILGGRRLHIMRKHVLPFLKPRLSILYSQQVVSTLLLLAHLGVLKVFIGGTDIITLDPLENNTLPVAMINEWSSMIGAYIYELRGNTWVIYTPLAGFAVAILAMNFMVEAMKRQYLAQGGYTVTKRLFRKKKMTVPVKKMTDEQFERIMKTGSEG
ncbi:ABC transporter permease subunit [Fictibacillus barbaricus]|uniref:Peptide/nickel transport system permease protein n=1 Tax=Fictibacillus barbaricus TaxID=182136 RepID=A0ABU1TW70_9BACL|nr:ABC transporter permease subunit [Fictibacillus barbaricus]MDR7071437.1 peptide/nickel transport system permease protein [Fictibacillus barbaricus]